MKKILLIMACVLGFSVAASANVVDVLTVDDLNVAGSTSQNYNTFTVTGESGAEYKLQCAHNQATCLQFRTKNNNSGLVVTKSAGKVVAVTLTWGKDNTASHKMNIYTSADAYTAPTALYASGLTAEGSIEVNNTNTFTLTSPAEYIGMRSDDGAIYLTKIAIEWEIPSAVAAPEITCTDNTVTITATDADAIYYTTDGTEPTQSENLKYTAPFAITANTTVKAIAVKGEEKSDVVTFNAVYFGNYDNYKDLTAKGAGAMGSVSNVTAIYHNGSYLYTVDSKRTDGSYMLLFDNSFSSLNVANGDEFATVEGTYTLDNGLPMLTNITLGNKTAGTKVDPTSQTLEEVALLGEDMLNWFVKIEGVTITANGSDFMMLDAEGKNPVALNNTFGTTIGEGENCTVTGFVSYSNEAICVVPTDVVVGTKVEHVADLTFDVTSGEVVSGTVVKITTTTEGASIYYTNDDTEPSASSTPYNSETGITITEPVTIKAIALKEGMLPSAVATETYTIFDPNAPKTATFDFTQPATLFTLDKETGTTGTVAVPGSNSGTNLSNATLTDDKVNKNVTITFSANMGANDIRLYNNTNGSIDLRMYHNSNGTNQYFIVEVPDKDYVIDQIGFTGKTLAQLKSESGTYSESSTTATWTSVDASGNKVYPNSVKFISTGKPQISTITVTYVPAPATTKYESYKDLVEAGEGTKGSVETVTAIYHNGQYLYTKDSKDNYMLLNDNSFNSLNVANGDQFVTVDGTYTLYNGLPELTDVKLGAKTTGTAVEPFEWTLGDISQGFKDLEMLNWYVTMTGVTVYNDGSNYVMTAEDAAIPEVIDDKFGVVKTGLNCTLTGFVSCDNDAFRFVPTEITVGTATTQVAAPQFSVESGDVAAGTFLTITADADATIYYTTDGSVPTQFAKVFEGDIAIDKSMTVKAIAIKDGMLTSSTSVATYYVKDDTEATATFNFTDPTTLGLSGSGNISVENATFTAGEGAVSIKFSGNNGHTAPRIYDSNGKYELRMYDTQYFEISVAAGNVIKKIDFTSENNSLSQLGCDASSDIIGDYKANGTAAVWTDFSTKYDTDKVTFTANPGTTRISTITVTYVKGTPTGVDDIAVDEVENEDAPVEYYNLQGVRVENPTAGFYIVRRGNTVSKILVR